MILFIDGSNFYYSLKSIYGDKSLSNFNFKKFGEVLAGDRELLRIFYYNAPLNFNENPEKYARQQRFFEKLKNIGKIKLILTDFKKERSKEQINIIMLLRVMIFI